MEVRGQARTRSSEVKAVRLQGKALGRRGAAPRAEAPAQPPEEPRHQTLTWNFWPPEQGAALWPKGTSLRSGAAPAKGAVHGNSKLGFPVITRATTCSSAGGDTCRPCTVRSQAGAGRCRPKAGGTQFPLCLFAAWTAFPELSWILH